MLKKLWGRVSSGFGRVVGVACAAVAFVQCAVMGRVMAADVTVPDLGIDWAEIGTTAAAVLGAVVVGLIGVKVAISVVNMAIKMFSRMFS